MAESIILALDNGLLQKLKDADTALDDLGKKSDEITKKIISNFKEASEKGVEAFTQDVKNKIKNLNIDPIKVGLSLDPKAIDDLKKQIAGLGVTVPVGANVTGTTASGNIPNLQAVLDSIVKLSNNLLQSIKDFPFGKSVQASAYTPNQIETLNKRARAALYRGELNALTELSNKEKERQRNLREQDKENQLRHRNRINQIKIEEERNKLKIKAEIDELKRLAKAYKQMPTSIDTKQVGNLIAQSKQSQTVNQRITAVNNLKNALKDLDTTDRRYQRTVSHLNKEIRRQESELRKLGYQMNKVKEHSHNLFNISGQLGRALSLMFSVSQITGYIRKMVDVRKEMELQQRSLQVLLQNKDKANELWNQTLDLAVKSPFRVKELVTYTKQLAAYRIESDKLFETNKMLADVSAGLGVDMQRLILAFGQVKSASFLRGTELRQFTEAGIPMLEELSKYFSEIYGKSVSVAEVFDMISKRMVTFTDVEKVFQRMTGAGGVFFNMQEELSQTTAGLISNLQDSIDLMFNDMGKKNQGIINGVIKAARGLVDNWEVIGVVMKGTLVTLLLYKAATMNISGILDNIAAKWKNLQAAGPLFKENPLEFLKTFKGNAIMFALTAIASLIIKIYAEHQRYKQALREVEEEHEKFRNSISKVENDFADVFKNGSDNIEDYKGKLQELIGIAQQSYNIELDFNVNDLNTIDEVSRKFDELKEKILSFDNLSLEFGLNFVERDDRGWGWFEDYLGKDLTQLGESQKAISKAFYDIRTNMSGVLKDYYEYQRLMQNNNNLNEQEVERLEELSGRFGNANTEIFESFKKQNYDEETSYDFFQRNVEGLREWIKEYDRLLNQYFLTFHQSDLDNLNNFSAGFTRADVTDFKKLLEDYDDKIKEATIELDKFYQKTEDDISLRVADLNTTNVTVIEKELSNMVYNSLKKIATEKGYNELILNEMLSQAEKYYKDNLGYELDLLPKIKTADPIQLKQWQQTFNEKVKKAVESISGKMQTEEYNYDLFGIFSISEDLQGLSTTETKKLAELNQALDEAVKRREEILGKQKNKSPLFKQEELDDIDLYIQGLTFLRDLLGGDDDKVKSKKKNKTLKESINDDISILKSAYDKFQELNENFSSAESFEKVKQAYGKAVGEISGLTIKQSADIGNATEIITESIENYDNALVGFTKAHESFRAEAYDLGDSAITIGYGSTNKMFPDEGIVMGATITEGKAEELLRKTLNNRNDNLKKVIEEKSQELGIEINQSMYNALIDMGYQGAGDENFYTIFFDRVLNVDKGATYISNIAEKIGEVFGEDFEHPFTESFIDAFKASDIEHRIAMMLEASNLTINGGKISKTLFGGMLKRSQDRRDLAMGSLEYDFTTLEGLKKALESLIPKAASAGEQAMNALLKAISDVDVEIGVRARIKENKKIAKEISDMFSGYEIGLELKDLNIPSNIVKDVFGEYFDNLDIDVSLDEILNKIQQFKDELDRSDIDISSQLNADNVTEESKKILQSELEGNRKRREQLTKDEQKVTEMLNKEYLERLKTYTKYLLNEQHERVKIRMETLRMLQEVEDTEEYTSAQRQTITDKIKEEERKKLAQQTWKDFEQSPMYMQMFDDVENMGKGALESLITQMGTLKDELQSMGLPASDLKEILGAINKAEEELERRNPFKNFGKNAKIAFTSAKRLKELEEQRAREQKVYEDTKSTYDQHQDLLAREEKKLESLKKGSEEYKQQLAWVELLRRITNNLAENVTTTETNLSNTNTQINDINDSSNDFYDQLKNIGTITKSVVDGIFQIADAMSGLPEETQLSIDRLQSLSENVFGIAGGIGSIMSGDIVGGITQIVGSLSGLITTFVEWSSGTKEATIQIERQGRILSNLQNKYDRLNEAIDEAWNTQQIKEYNAELEKNLQQQIIAQKAIIAAQESIKGSDRYGSEQWLELQEAQEELQNLYDMQQELQDNIYEKITGGIIDNTIDAASAWVDVWYDAFKETGDGFKGLEENHKEMLLNLVKRQAAMNVAGKFIDQWNAALERYADDGSLSFGEITSWANMIEQDLPALSSQLEAFFNAFNGVLGDTQGNLSGLQRGIQGITEQQADILASYLNSIRFIVSDSNAQLKLLVAAQTGATARSENPMVEQLRVIANNTRMLYSLFDGMTSAHSSGGRGLKVVI